MADPKQNDAKAPAATRINELFDEGRRFTEEVMEENARLRMMIAGQRNSMRDLQREREQDLPMLRERLVLLEEENQTLRQELDDIKKQYNAIERENWDFSERYLHVERQNTSLLNLYVASQRLSSTLRFELVIQVIKELVVNLIGSEAFELCLYDSARGQERVVVLAGVGNTIELGGLVPMDGAIARAVQQGIAFVQETGESAAGLAACIPLKLEERVLGVIIIRALLPQKSAFEPIDRELFELLGERAGAAVVASYLYSRAKVHDDARGWTALVNAMVDEAHTIDQSEVEPTVVW
jgi:nitrate/nitrite-specific signal transduction histidine kinase